MNTNPFSPAPKPKNKACSCTGFVAFFLLPLSYTASFESPWLSKVSPGEQIHCLQFLATAGFSQDQTAQPHLEAQLENHQQQPGITEKIKSFRDKKIFPHTFTCICTSESCPWCSDISHITVPSLHSRAVWISFSGPYGFRASPGNSASLVWQEHWSIFPAALIRKQRVKQDETSSPFLEDLLQFPQCSQRQC